MKGIILAGGSGTRLWPLTENISKHMLPVYDKPMVYYPLSVLMLADIREILLITTAEDIDLYKNTLGDGERFGISLSYTVQDKPNGIAEAFLLGEDFIGKDNVCLILGDNIFYGASLSQSLSAGSSKLNGATIFGCHVSDPSRFGVVEFDKNMKAINIEEKPSQPKSDYAVTGLYFYDNQVVEFAKKLKPSERGELEISDINRMYLEKEALEVKVFDRGFTWLDTGTIDSLMDASHFVQTIEKQQGFKIACLEEIALNKGWISLDSLYSRAKLMPNSSYGVYLQKIYTQYKEREKFEKS